MSRLASITRCALRKLHQAGGYALPEGTLAQHLDADLRPPVSEAEFAAAIAWLVGEHFIAALPGEAGDPEPRWLLAERGEAFVKKHHLA
jgi:hypothetical protein